MNEIITSLKHTIENRLKNKAIASFLISFSLWNWKGILIFILSSKNIKIDMINNFDYGICDHFLIPAAIAFLYITCSPHITYWFSLRSELNSIDIAEKNADIIKQNLKIQKDVNHVRIYSDFEFQKDLEKHNIEGAKEKLEECEHTLMLTQELLDQSKENNALISQENSELQNKVNEITSILDASMIDPQELSFLKDHIAFSITILDELLKETDSTLIHKQIIKAIDILHEKVKSLPETKPLRTNESLYYHRQRDLLSYDQQREIK